MIENDWLDHDFIDEHTVGFDAVGRARRASGRRARTAEVTGIAERAIRQAAEWWGTAKTSFLMHARGIEHHSHGVQNCLGAINIVLASGRIGRAGLRLRDDHRPGQRPGRPRARPEVRPAPGLRATSTTPSTAPTSPASGASRPEELPQAGRRLLRDVPQDRRGRDQGPALASASTRWSRCRTTRSSRAMLEKLEFFVAIDFFLSETARHADIVLPGSLHEEDEGIVAQRRGPGHQDQQGGRPARRGAAGLADHPGHRRRRSAGPRGFTFASPREIFDELRVASKGGVADYSGHHLREDRGAATASSGPARRRTIRARRGCSSRGRGTRSRKGAGPFYFPDGKARFNVAAYAPPAEDVDAEYPLILTTGPRGQPVPLRDADAAHRAAGRPVPGAAASRCTRRLAAKLGHRRRRLGDGRVAARRAARCGPRW